MEQTPFTDKLSDYDIKSVLGKGSQGNVYLVQHRVTNQKYAMKVITLDIIKNENDQKRLRDEVEVQKYLSSQAFP